MISADLSTTSIARPAGRSDPAYQLFVAAVALAPLAIWYAPGWRTS
jgi:hypothetical protein